MNKKKIIDEYLKKIAAKGGKTRAARHSKAQLRKWGRLGGRPRREGRTS